MILEVNETLLLRIAEDDTAAFEEFYRQTERNVYALALSIVKNHEDALDVTQDTYLKLHASTCLYKPSGKPMAWVYTIAKNLAIDSLRARERQYVGMEKTENDVALSYTIDSVDKLALRTALRHLSREEGKIVALHVIYGLTNSEIAAKLGLNLSTVLSKYRRSLKKLRKYLDT